MQAVLGYGSRGYGGGRALDAGFAASVVLHAALFSALAGVIEAPRDEEPAPGPIFARLVAAVAPQPVEAPEQEKIEKAPARVAEPVKHVKAEELPLAPRQPMPTEARLERTPVPIQPEPVRAAPEPLPAAAPEPAAPIVKAAPAPAASAPERQSIAAARPAPPPAPRPSALDPATLGQYRSAVLSAARRHMAYPRAARDNNWEGRVEVQMVVAANGSITSIRVKKGTGYQILDEQALDMIRRAAPETTVPAALRGREFTVDLPVIFDLLDPSA